MFADCITSFIDGRLRVRHPALRDAEQAERIRALLGFMPGVLSVEVNPRTGSLLLHYDPAQLSREDLLQTGGQWLGQVVTVPAAVPAEAPESRSVVASRVDSLGSKACGSRGINSRGINRGMLISLALSLAFGLTGKIGIHAVAGGLFVLFNALHLYKYRRCL